MLAVRVPSRARLLPCKSSAVCLPPCSCTSKRAAKALPIRTVSAVEQAIVSGRYSSLIRTLNPRRTWLKGDLRNECIAVGGRRWPG